MPSFSPTSVLQPPTSSSETEVLVKVKGVSKKFCRDLKKSLWYGVKDVASEFLPFQNSKFKIQNSSEALRPGEFWANKDISFELRRGECVGLIGRNGAGKTTLLKMLTGLIKPDSGSIEIRGRIGALIALGTGFNPILTGRENIYVNGSILGLTKDEIDSKIEDIIEFAEIREFINSPVQSYSSGMQVRLGFAVATALTPDVLIIDEALAVGDVQFRTKCYNRLAAVRNQTAIIFVSHQRSELSRVCDLGLVLNAGIGTQMMSLSAALTEYDNLNLQSDSKSFNYADTSIDIHEVRLLNSIVSWGEDVLIDASFSSKFAFADVFQRVTILDSASNCVAEWNSLHHSDPITLRDGENQLRIRMRNLRLASGTYQINYVLGSINASDYLALMYSFAKLTVKGNHTGLSTYQI